MDISIDPTTGVISDNQRRAIGYIERSGNETRLLAERHGKVLATLQEDGNILAGDRYAGQLGYVRLDGQVRRKDQFGPVVGTVQPPNQLVKAALLLLRW